MKIVFNLFFLSLVVVPSKGEIRGWNLIDATIDDDPQKRVISYLDRPEDPDLDFFPAVTGFNIEYWPDDPDPIESMQITVNGESRCENNYPYSAFGDSFSPDFSTGHSFGRPLKAGVYDLEAIAYASPGCTGDVVEIDWPSPTYTFTMEDRGRCPGEVEDYFYFIRLDDGAEVKFAKGSQFCPWWDNYAISVPFKICDPMNCKECGEGYFWDACGCNSLCSYARCDFNGPDVPDWTIESVSFELVRNLGGGREETITKRVENAYPYTLWGDSNGKYFPGEFLENGSYILKTFTASEDGLRGKRSAVKEFPFSIDCGY